MEWIELDSPTKRSVPQLRLDTTNLSPQHRRTNSHNSSRRTSSYISPDSDVPPQSAILGLAANLKSEWMPPERERSVISNPEFITPEPDRVIPSLNIERSFETSSTHDEFSPIQQNQQQQQHQNQNLTLSGIGINAQRDFIDIEESRSTDDSPIERSTTPLSETSNPFISKESKIDMLSEPMGRSFFFLTSKNKFRNFVFKICVSKAMKYFMVLLTLLQIIVLCIEQGPTFQIDDNEAAVISNEKYNSFYQVLYALFTLAFILESIAFGVFTNKYVSFQDIQDRCKLELRRVLYIFSLGARKKPQKRIEEDKLTRFRCSLRSSWGRVEAISILFFWIFTGLSTGDVVESLELFLWGLGNLRILRMLDYIIYTRTILRVIKTAIPYLQNVLIFIAFFVSIYAIVGIQAFNGSLRRVCIQGDIITTQHCGSWLEAENLEVMPYMRLDTRNGSYQTQNTIKGYTCPVGSVCVELRAYPPSGSFKELANESFDNFFNSLEIVLIMMSNNGFTEILYQIIDSEYLVSSLFFISGVLVLGIWLMNLLVAVMVSSYAAVKRQLNEEEKPYESLSDWIKMKLSSKPKDAEINESASEYSRDYNDDSREEDETIADGEDYRHDKRQIIGRWYNFIHLCFTILALIDLIVQAVLTAPDNNMLPWESFLTAAFAFEIVLRFIAYYPNWRLFLFSATCLIDIGLVIANVIALIFYDNHEIYSWLTAFQLLRIYRLVGAIKYSRLFWLQIFGNFRIFGSLTLFYFATTLLATLIATKMLRGQFPLYDDDGNINMFSFYDLAASFFSMYQVSSTENWTDVLFWTTNNVSRTGANVVGLACIGILFFGWLFFSNFLVLNLFIGVMSDNLHGSIVNKREEQVRRFAEEIRNQNERDTTGIFSSVFSNLDILQDDAFADADRHVTMRDRLWGFIVRLLMWNAPNRSKISPMHAAVEQKFVIEFLESNGGLERILEDAQKPRTVSTFLSLDAAEIENVHYGRYPFFKKLKSRIWKALGYLHHYPPEFREMLKETIDERRKEAISNSSTAFVESMFDTKKYELTVLEKYCAEHPNFDKSLFIFDINNPIRRFCQHFFSASNGTRRSKVEPGKWINLLVRLFFMAATLCIVIFTCIRTPLEALNQRHHAGTWARTTIYDLVFGTIFLVEFLGKVIADGLHFTPNAYTWSMWNNVEFVVLASIWVTLVNDILNGPVSRYVRALMALRALRLLGFYPDNFRILNSAIRHGLRNIFGAVIIIMTIVIPYSVWGKNIFHNRLSQCNDGNINYFAECDGEYTNTLFDNFDVLSPRAVTGQYFDYDNFWNALLIQFGVLSLEGWVDVLQAVASISSTSQQSITFDSKGNALYPILYNYIGTVLIMTMLIAVIIRNYAIITGTAFLTEQQLSWLDVKRTLGLIKPTPKPPRYKNGSLRAYLLSIMPTWIQSTEIFVLLVVTLNLAAYFYPLKPEAETIYRLVQVACSILLVALSFIRLVVLKPALFCHSWWNPFGLIVCILVTVLTIVTLVEPAFKVSGVAGVNRAAVIAMLLLWIPRTKQLYQFYSIGTAALNEISVLLRAWFTLYIAYAIALNQSFGLTKLGTQSTWSKNFRTIPKALISLFFMSCGEGWNQYLMDFVISKPYCIENSSYSECGISGFAYFLFISWNIVSMYVFANLFISLICEGCWYVYRSGPVNINERDMVTLLESWQMFDPRGAGLIRTRDLHRFLGVSRGYFNIGIFSQDPHYSVKRILEETNANSRSVIDPYRVDVDAINGYLADMPVHKYRQKKILYELFSAHSQLISESMPGGSGIRFSKLVLLFPLYNDMDPAESLTLKEFIELKAQLYEASLVVAAEFIAATWRAKQKLNLRRVSTSSIMVTPYHGEEINP